MGKDLTCYCKKHNKIFNRKAKHIIYHGRGRDQCSHEKRSEIGKLSEDEISSRIYKSNPDIKIVSFNNYTNIQSYIKVRCVKCGYEWESPIASIFYNGTSCPSCCSSSKGEQKISHVLDENNIKFQPQYIFNDCRYKKPLPFDNSILDENGNVLYLIEYHGEQHYHPIEYFGGEENFKTQQKRDEIKLEYCKKNNIPLLIIPYWDYSKIEERILEIVNI